MAMSDSLCYQQIMNVKTNGPCSWWGEGWRTWGDWTNILVYVCKFINILWGWRNIRHGCSSTQVLTTFQLLSLVSRTDAQHLILLLPFGVNTWHTGLKKKHLVGHCWFCLRCLPIKGECFLAALACILRNILSLQTEEYNLLSALHE